MDDWPGSSLCGSCRVRLYVLNWWVLMLWRMSRSCLGRPCCEINWLLNFSFLRNLLVSWRILLEFRLRLLVDRKWLYLTCLVLFLSRACLRRTCFVISVRDYVNLANVLHLIITLLSLFYHIPQVLQGFVCQVKQLMDLFCSLNCIFISLKVGA